MSTRILPLSIPKIFSFLKELIESVQRENGGHKRYKLYIATANLKIKDSGDCGNGYNGWGRRGGYGC